MEIEKLNYNNENLIIECDKLLALFIDSEGTYDNNYLKRDLTHSFKEDLLDDNKLLLACTEGEKVLGFLYAYTSQSKGDKFPIAHLCFLYVDVKHRNKKIGTMLVDEFLQEMKSRNIQFVEVKAFKNNIAANNLYKKYGFDVLWSNYRKNI